MEKIAQKELNTTTKKFAREMTIQRKALFEIDEYIISKGEGIFWWIAICILAVASFFVVVSIG